MYEFNTTEQNLGKANDFETKAMLYLMSFRADSKNITISYISNFYIILSKRNEGIISVLLIPIII